MTAMIKTVIDTYKNVYYSYRGYGIEYIEHLNAYRVYSLDNPYYTCAYEDSIDDAVKDINFYEDRFIEGDTKNV